MINANLDDVSTGGVWGCEAQDAAETAGARWSEGQCDAAEAEGPKRHPEVLICRFIDGNMDSGFGLAVVGFQISDVRGPEMSWVISL